MRNNGFRLMPESYIILIVNIIDLFITFYLVESGKAREGNPIMAFYLQIGWIPLMLLKMGMTGTVILISEWAKEYHPVFVRNMLRFAVIAYIVMYIIAFLIKPRG
ncbi:MAG: DUF5658 family protein [Armatimonadota bacterium]